jgi:hypothetical protein
VSLCHEVTIVAGVDAPHNPPLRVFQAWSVVVMGRKHPGALPDAVLIVMETLAHLISCRVVLLRTIILRSNDHSSYDLAASLDPGLVHNTL